MRLVKNGYSYTRTDAPDRVHKAEHDKARFDAYHSEAKKLRAIASDKPFTTALSLAGRYFDGLCRPGNRHLLKGGKQRTNRAKRTKGKAESMAADEDAG